MTKKTDAEYEYLFRDADPRWKAYYRMRREEYRKEHPCTNFDKWKEGLTPEETAKKLETSSLVCGFCPARYECAGTGTGCRTQFLAWANAPAKEEDK